MAIISLVFWGPSYLYLPSFSAIQSTQGFLQLYFADKRKKMSFAFVEDFLLRFVVNCWHCSESQNLGIPPITHSFTLSLLNSWYMHLLQHFSSWPKLRNRLTRGTVGIIQSNYSLISWTLWKDQYWMQSCMNLYFSC